MELTRFEFAVLLNRAKRQLEVDQRDNPPRRGTNQTRLITKALGRLGREFKNEGALLAEICRKTPQRR
jgi:hypothetical protein